MERRTTVHPNALCALWLLSLFCVSVRLQTVWIRSNRFKISVNIDTTWSVCRWGKCPQNTCSSNNMVAPSSTQEDLSDSNCIHHQLVDGVCVHCVLVEHCT